MAGTGAPYPQKAFQTAFWHGGNGFAVIHISRGDAKAQQFAPVIDNQMQLKAKEPTCGSFVLLSQPGITYQSTFPGEDCYPKY